MTCSQRRWRRHVRHDVDVDDGGMEACTEPRVSVSQTLVLGREGSWGIGEVMRAEKLRRVRMLVRMAMVVDTAGQTEWHGRARTPSKSRQSIGGLDDLGVCRGARKEAFALCKTLICAFCWRAEASHTLCESRPANGCRVLNKELMLKVWMAVPLAFSVALSGTVRSSDELAQSCGMRLLAPKGGLISQAHDERQLRGIKLAHYAQINTGHS